MPEKAKSKWLLGGILKHHCPLCATPLASEKGRRCLGEHVEWCPKYHGLCRVGHKDRCPACHNIAEQHEKRHRQIAELWHQVKRAQHAPVGAPIAGPQPDTSPEEEDDATPHLPSPHSSPSPRKREKKAAKKASKAQNRDRTAVSSAELAAVANALHPDAAAAEDDDEEVDSDIAFSPKEDLDLAAETARVLSLLLHVPLSDREIAVPSHGSESTEIPTLLSTLANAIREDLHCSREERMRAVRAEADFRAWATAKAFVRKAEREGRRSSGESRHSGDDGKEDGNEESGEGDGYEGDGEGLQEGTLEAYEMGGKAGNGEEGVEGERTGMLGEETKKVVEGKIKRAPTVSKPLAAGRLILCSNGGLHHLRKKLSER